MNSRFRAVMRDGEARTAPARPEGPQRRAHRRAEIAKRRPTSAVFLDAGFASDAARINAEHLFREVSPETDVRAI